MGAGLCVRRAQRSERGKRTPLIGYEVSRLGGTEAAAPRHHSPCALRFADSPARRQSGGVSHMRIPMLIFLALILAASLIAMQAAGLWVDRR